MSLLTLAELRALVPSPLAEAALQIVLDWVEAELTDAIGGPYVDGSTTISARVQGGGESIFLKRKLTSVSTVREYGTLADTTGTLLTQNVDYFVWSRQGQLQRLGNGFGLTASLSGTGASGRWGTHVDVAFVPVNDNPERKIVTADLVRIVLSQTALKGEGVAGEYSYQAPSNWEEEKRRVLRRVSFLGV